MQGVPERLSAMNLVIYIVVSMWSTQTRLEWPGLPFHLWVHSPLRPFTDVPVRTISVLDEREPNSSFLRGEKGIYLIRTPDTCRPICIQALGERALSLVPNLGSAFFSALFLSVTCDVSGMPTVPHLHIYGSNSDS